MSSRTRLSGRKLLAEYVFALHDRNLHYACKRRYETFCAGQLREVVRREFLGM